MKNSKLILLSLFTIMILSITGCNTSTKKSQLDVESTSENITTEDDLEATTKEKDIEISKLTKQVTDLEAEVKRLTDVNEVLSAKISSREPDFDNPANLSLEEATNLDKNDKQESTEFNSTENNSDVNNTTGIAGAHDVTVKVNTDYNEFIEKLIEGVSGNGNVTVDTNDVDLSKPGTYKAKWLCDDKVEATVKVIVKK